MTDNNDAPKSLSLAEFVPAKAELQAMAEGAKNVDTKNIALVHDTRIQLRDARVNITKRGKELRDGALKFQKTVIETERELIGIIEPEEERLEKAEDEAKLRAEMEKRRDELPGRKTALATIGDNMPVTDEELLAMTDDDFNAYRLRRIDAKLVRDREEFELKKQADAEEARRKAADEDRVRREKLEADEREAAAKRAEEDRLAAEKRAEADKVLNAERTKLEADKAAIEATKAEQERQAKLEKEKAEAAERLAAAEKEKEETAKKAADYQKWLADIKFDPATDITHVGGGEVKAYRLIGAYKRP
jgi:hypothetical protein